VRVLINVKLAINSPAPVEPETSSRGHIAPSLHASLSQQIPILSLSTSPVMLAVALGTARAGALFPTSVLATALSSIQPPIQRVPINFLRGIKRRERDVNYSLLSCMGGTLSTHLIVLRSCFLNTLTTSPVQ
jgi:hypothetical protein